MKTIKLTKDKYALVDDGDYEYLNQWHWYFDRYAKRRINNKIIPMHRVIMNTPEGMETDHINGDKLDNRRNNLRICTKEENGWNKVKRKDSKHSLYKGVELNKKTGLWITRMMNFKERIYIGYFKEERHAAMAYDIWARDINGEFANLNFNYQGGDWGHEPQSSQKEE